MRTLLAGLALLLGATFSFADDPACSVSKTGPETQASELLEKIGKQHGFDYGTILLYTSSDPVIDKNGGVMSVQCNAGQEDERWILYHPNYFPDASRDFAIAHEVAHFLNGDTLNGLRDTRKELRADRYAATYLAALGWTKEQLLQALDGLKLPSGVVDGYPSIQERRESVIEGFTAYREPVKAVEAAPTINEVPPLVKNGAPVGAKFEFTYTKNATPCVKEYVKVSPTKWNEQPSSRSPRECFADETVLSYTERQSNDGHFILLYDEGRKLLARLPNIGVGAVGLTDWRLISSKDWNSYRFVERVQ